MIPPLPLPNAELESLRSDLAEALSLLSQLEWDTVDGMFDEGVCPVCGGFDRIHKPDCRLAALLAKHKETP